MEIKHLYQLRSSPKEAGWYYFMLISAKRKPITDFPSSCKNWKNKFFFAGGNWCPAIQSLGGDLHLPTRFVTPDRLFFFALYVSCRCLSFSLTLFLFLDSWGMVSRLDDDPLLKVETALVNASTYRDLLSPTNLLGSCLVDVVSGMDNKILSATLRKRARVSSDSSNAPSPLKKNNVSPSNALALALPPPTRKNGGEKPCDKSPEVSAPSRDRTSSPPPRDRGDHLASYKKIISNQ